jgi:hypothetical protein
MKKPTRHRDLKDVDQPQVVEPMERNARPPPDDSKRVKAMEITRRVFRAYASTFKALAK